MSKEKGSTVLIDLIRQDLRFFLRYPWLSIKSIIYYGNEVAPQVIEDPRATGLGRVNQ